MSGSFLKNIFKIKTVSKFFKQSNFKSFIHCFVNFLEYLSRIAENKI